MAAFICLTAVSVLPFGCCPLGPTTTMASLASVAAAAAIAGLAPSSTSCLASESGAFRATACVRSPPSRKPLIIAFTASKPSVSPTRLKMSALSE